MLASFHVFIIHFCGDLHLNVITRHPVVHMECWGEGIVLTLMLGQSSCNTVHKYPSSSHCHHNWDALEAQMKAEEKDEKLDGDAALNKLFQQIYADGNDETRRAMNKSFVSNITLWAAVHVLTTNNPNVFWL